MGQDFGHLAQVTGAENSRMDDSPEVSTLAAGGSMDLVMDLVMDSVRLSGKVGRQ